MRYVDAMLDQLKKSRATLKLKLETLVTVNEIDTLIDANLKRWLQEAFE